MRLKHASSSPCLVCSLLLLPHRPRPQTTIRARPSRRSISARRQASFDRAAAFPARITGRTAPDYSIHAMLDPTAHTISGTMRNPLHQQQPGHARRRLAAARAEPLPAGLARRRSSNGGSVPQGFTGGMILEPVSIQIGRLVTIVQPLISDTRAQLRLPAPLAPKAQAILRFRYHYMVPKEPIGAAAPAGWQPARRRSTAIAQWYPRMAVYDDIRGWDPLPYLQQEFYLEYGDFDYWVTVPANMSSPARASCVNPEEVLTAPQRARLAQARHERRDGDDPHGRRAVRLRDSATAHLAFPHAGHARRRVRRVAAPSSGTPRASACRAASRRSQCPSTRRRAHRRWGRSTEYLKDAVERFSAKWYPYPWPAAINVAGPAAGMEYPGIVFDGIDDAGQGAVLDHRARDRPQLVPDDRRLRRAPQRLDGRRLQHLHRRL